MSYQLKNLGFTLIELLIVIAILGIMATAVLVGINPLGKIQQARDSIRKSDLRQMANALEAYFITNGSYPSTGGSTVYVEGKCTNPVPGLPDWVVKPDYSGANAYIPNLAPSYIKTLLGDPNVNGISARCYIYMSDSTNYALTAHMGAEAPFQPNDPMIRLYPEPACNNTQASFVIKSDGTRCW